MKKILTLLVMFLTMWSILGAQTPVFGYQAVIRTTDNELVESTPVAVTISVLNGGTVMYSETHPNMSTDPVGMLSMLVGNGNVVTGSVEDVDWADATLRAEVVIDGGETVVVESPIYAAPYALQAVKTTLTTERIVQYVQDPATDVTDYAQCMTALGNNVPENGLMWQKTKQRIYNYVKNHRDIALDVVVAYLETGTAEDMLWLKNKITSTGALEEAIQVFAEFALEHRDFAMEVLIDYLEVATPQEANQIIDAILTHESDLLPVVIDYASTHRNRAFMLVKKFFETATADEVSQALGAFKTSGMKQKYVDELFYSHLDNYLQVSNSLTEAQIKALVNARMGQYLQKVQCGGEDVDICDIRDKVDVMLGH